MSFRTLFNSPNRQAKSNRRLAVETRRRHLVKQSSRRQLRHELLEDRRLLALTFQFNPDAGTSREVIQGFRDAGRLWQGLFDDNVTVVVDIAEQNLGATIIGSTLRESTPVAYTNVRNALLTDARTVDDVFAASNLSMNPALNIQMNLTSDNPNGVGSAVPYVDNDAGANNTLINVPRSNARALGLIAPNDPIADGRIVFNTTNFTFDFDRTDGIAAGATDFVFIAAHEIGHLLGFVSGVDSVDINDGQGGRPGPFAENTFASVTVLDLFRQSVGSIAAGADLDFSADIRGKFLSLDGATPFRNGQFATGLNNGDGNQASHWRDNSPGTPIGFMDPNAAGGEFGVVTGIDLTAFDVIGWDLALDDAYEPNNTRGSATPLGSAPAVFLTDLTIGSGDEDFFQYTAHDTGKLVVNALFDDIAGDIDLEILDSNGNLLARASSTTDNENLVIPVVSQETYFIHVVGFPAFAVNEYSLEIENFPAPVPVVVDLRATSDSGRTDVDDNTNDQTPTIDVLVDLVNFYRNVTNGDNFLTAAQASAGNVAGFAVQLAIVNTATGAANLQFAEPLGALSPLWRYTPTVAWPAGSYMVSAAVYVVDAKTPNAVDSAVFSEPLLLVIDPNAPAAPALPDLLAASDSGLFDNDNVTNIQAVAIAGTAVEPNTKVRVFAGTQLVGQGMATTSGTYEITTEPLRDGLHDITVELEDLAGNISARSVTLRIEIDTLAPNLPFLDLVEADDTGRHNDDNITRVLTPDFTATTTDPNAGAHLLAANLAYRVYDRDEGSIERLLFSTALLAPAAVPVAANNLTLTVNQWNNLKLEVEDRAGNISPDFLLHVLVDATAPAAPSIALDPSVTDSGIATNPTTLADRITRYSTPGFVGRAEADNIVRLFADGPVVTNNLVDASDTAIGVTVAVPLDGDEAFPGGQYRATSTVDLNNPTAGFPRDGQRQIGATAEDLAGNVSPAAFVDILVDTTPGRVTRVDLAGNRTVFATKPDLTPTPAVHSLFIEFSGGPPAAAGLSSPAVDNNLAKDVRNYQLVGDHNGNVLIGAAEIVSSTPEKVVVRLDFIAPLADDRFTLTIKESISDAAGNLLDGDSQAQSPGSPTQLLPSGNGLAGGNFVARFTVDSRPEIGAISEGLFYVDINGNLEWDPTGSDNDATNRDFVFQFGQLVDAHFAGNFAKTGAATASGFDKLGAYGKFGPSYSFSARYR